MTVEDHRVRVAAERRARMKRRLIESALLVFAEKGFDAADIKDVAVLLGSLSLPIARQKKNICKQQKHL